jgi:hypothetical protein
MARTRSMLVCVFPLAGLAMRSSTGMMFAFFVLMVGKKIYSKKCL